jgi:hypothetical protein
MKKSMCHQDQESKAVSLLIYITNNKSANQIYIFIYMRFERIGIDGL